MGFPRVVARNEMESGFEKGRLNFQSALFNRKVKLKDEIWTVL